VGSSIDTGLLTENAVLFWIIAALTGISAIAVVVTQNIVRSATWLLFTLGGVAGIYFLIGADFVGSVQLIVYVGGILVLVVFGVMLTAQGPFVTMRAGAAEWVVAFVVGVVLFSVLAYTTGKTLWYRGDIATDKRMSDATNSMSSPKLGLAFLGFKEITPSNGLTSLASAAPPPTSASRRPGRATFGSAGDTGLERRKVGYLLPFEIVSVHLLVVLIAAAYLARAKRRRRSA
jgi:NADH:ubiquinone oxidoreductase subunit 6 (subunit J)